MYNIESIALVLKGNGKAPGGGMEGPEKVMLNMSNISIFSMLSIL